MTGHPWDARRIKKYHPPKIPRLRFLLLEHETYSVEDTVELADAVYWLDGVLPRVLKDPERVVIKNRREGSPKLKRPIEEGPAWAIFREQVGAEGIDLVMRARIRQLLK
jgi:hypothetical protein